MHSVIRNYPGARGLADELLKHRSEIEREVGGVSGFIAYYLLKTSDVAMSVTVCDDRRGCEESSTRAASWLRKSLPNLKLEPPQILSGEVCFRFANYPAKV